MTAADGFNFGVEASFKPDKWRRRMALEMRREWDRVELFDQESLKIACRVKVKPRL
jgi:hypothetical protein